MEAESRRLELRWLPVEVDESQFERVGKPYVLELKGGGGCAEGVASVEAAPEPGVSRTFGGHEQMFADRQLDLRRGDD